MESTAAAATVTASVVEWTVNIFSMKPRTGQPETFEEVSGVVVLDIPGDQGCRYLLVNCQGYPHFFVLEKTGYAVELNGIRGIPKKLKEAFREELEDWSTTSFLTEQVAGEIHDAVCICS